MAKRAPTDQKPFTALDKGLAASVMNPSPPPPAAEPVAAQTPAPATAPQRAVEAPQGRRETEGAVSVPNLPERVLEPPVVAPTPSITARRPVLAPKAAAGEAHVEKLSREKRVLLSPSEEREIERCVDRIAEGFGGTPVKLSHIVRACLAVVRHAESQVIRRAQDVGQLSRPPNGDTMAMVEFEHEIAKVLSHAFREAPPLR